MKTKRLLLLLVSVFVFAILVPGSKLQAAPQTMADGQLFDAQYYAQRNPDVVAAFGNDANWLYLHYVVCGKAEGRLPYDPSFAGGGSSASTGNFDAAYYAARYPDVAAVFGTDPTMLKMHYDLCGKAEGRFANAAEELGSTTVIVTPVGHLSYEMQVLNLCNAERAKYGLAPLVWDDSNLAPGAAVRAVEISVSFSHTRPDGSSCFTAVRNPGWLGENIAAGQRTPEEVVNCWMNSPGHRANILNSNFHKLGVGYYYTGTGYASYWVQMFSS